MPAGRQAGRQAGRGSFFYFYNGSGELAHARGRGYVRILPFPTQTGGCEGEPTQPTSLGVDAHLCGRLNPELAVVGAEGIEGPDLAVARGVFAAVQISEESLSEVSGESKRRVGGQRRGRRRLGGKGGEWVDRRCSVVFLPTGRRSIIHWYTSTVQQQQRQLRRRRGLQQ